MSRIRVCIDRGGTFTDCIAFIPSPSGTKEIVVKLLSVDPQNYDDAPREGIRRILEIATGKPHPRDKPVDTSNIDIIRMGTTVATNALLERKGEPCALLITKGFKDLLHIGTQARPHIFDLEIKCPDVLYDRVVEVDERVTLVNDEEGKKEDSESYQKGITGEWIQILQKPDLDNLRNQLQAVYSSGIRSIAICLMHSYTFPTHEHLIENLCKSIGFTNITLSSSIMPMVKIVPRGNSATADAYLTPCIKKYIEGFFSGFDEGIRDAKQVKVEFMQSDGGLTAVDAFSGFRAILSGPAGGVVGYALTSHVAGGKAVIGFDMGGTSTDVSRFDGRYEHVFETTTAGVTIQAPQLDINTVAAGGGSRLFFRNGLFVVGPESASADPGPTCYRKGGPLTITDANLFLGRLVPRYFPAIFGASEAEPLDLAGTQQAFHQLAKEINGHMAPESMSVDEIAYGFLKVANEAMCRPIRSLTQAKGFDTRDHVLACFGGAGGQHACAIARSLGIRRILIHKYASILSAYGLSLADVVHEEQEPCQVTLTDAALPQLRARIDHLIKLSSAQLTQQGFSSSQIDHQIYFNLRYQGTDTSLMILKPRNTDNWDFITPFLERYKQEFGFVLERDVIVDDVRVRSVGHSAQRNEVQVFSEMDTMVKNHVGSDRSESSEDIYWDGGRISTPVFLMENLTKGDQICGPALIIFKTATIVVEPSCIATITSEHVVIDVGSAAPSTIGTDLDPIRLSIFAHRFMGIAEQMGRTLQKTAVSTNIKERLDFSCAVFGGDGGLVANAPHIPVHLGSMQEAVRWQMNYLKGNLKEGDVIVANHPAAGGSHLPDITVITPVFHGPKIAFFVASRGHHADIGGIRPGSMPPDSTQLYQEGAAMKSFKLVSEGKFDEKGITRILLEEPAQYPGCSGSRCLRDCISDLKAQVAANHRGIQLVKALIEEFGEEVVHAYMRYIQKNAEMAVRTLLKNVAQNKGKRLESVDWMDDGTPIKLTVTIDEESGDATFDFTGTGLQVLRNTNAPRSITASAIIYTLRCLVASDIPLNQGALNPVRIIIPPGCLLSPSDDAAVVGGNVTTSQRVVDVVLKAFGGVAASQGCCNNFTFGRTHPAEKAFGYYETIAGGAGAGATWDGRSGVHTHMTNTRITDPEILERRYPVILREFGLRVGSGGRGLKTGGDGCVRELEFTEELDVSILSERRVFRPYGVDGGESGASGLNTLIQSDGTRINLGGKGAVKVQPGDRVRIETPGGGGYGTPPVKA